VIVAAIIGAISIKNGLDNADNADRNRQINNERTVDPENKEAVSETQGGQGFDNEFRETKKDIRDAVNTTPNTMINGPVDSPLSPADGIAIGINKANAKVNDPTESKRNATNKVKKPQKDCP